MGSEHNQIAGTLFGVFDDRLTFKANQMCVLNVDANILETFQTLVGFWVIRWHWAIASKARYIGGRRGRNVHEKQLGFLCNGKINGVSKGDVAARGKIDRAENSLLIHDWLLSVGPNWNAEVRQLQPPYQWEVGQAGAANLFGDAKFAFFKRFKWYHDCALSHAS